jgi:hypothetical protein
VKKKSKKYKFRNAAPRAARNAAPRAVKHHAKSGEETSLQRLGYTAAGTAASAFFGAFLAKGGWAPKTVSTALTTLGAGLTWKGDSPQAKSIGSGVMGASGGQLVMELLVDHEKKRVETEHEKEQKEQEPKKPSNAAGVPQASLEDALARAKTRLAMRSAA